MISLVLYKFKSLFKAENKMGVSYNLLKSRSEDSHHEENIWDILKDSYTYLAQIKPSNSTKRTHKGK
jgi:hypothetical protein